MHKRTMYGSAGMIINYLQGSQTILVEEQMYGQMLAVVVTYSVQQDRIVRQLSRKMLAVLGTVFYLKLA